MLEPQVACHFWCPFPLPSRKGRLILLLPEIIFQIKLDPTCHRRRKFPPKPNLPLAPTAAATLIRRSRRGSEQQAQPGQRGHLRHEFPPGDDGEGGGGVEDGEKALQGEGLGAEEVAGDLTTTGRGCGGGGEGFALLAPSPARGMLG